MSTALKCYKCGYDFSGLGDSTHVCLQQTYPQPKAGQDEPVFHLKQYGDVTKEQLDCYIATGRIDTCPQPREWIDLTGEELETLLSENSTLTLGAIWAVADKLKEKNT